MKDDEETEGRESAREILASFDLQKVNLDSQGYEESMRVYWHNLRLHLEHRMRAATSSVQNENARIKFESFKAEFHGLKSFVRSILHDFDSFDL